MLRSSLKKHAQFLRFLICGGTAALVNVGSRCLFNTFFDYRTSIILAFCMGLLTAFVLFKFMVFKTRASGTAMREALWFILVNALALAQTLLISIGLTEYIFPVLGFTWYAATIAHMIGVVSPVLSSYWGHKYVTFSRSAHVAHKLG